MGNLLLILLTKAATAADAGAPHIEKVVPKGLVPSHDFAVWLLNIIDKVLDFFGLAHHQTVEEVIYTVLILGVSLLIGMAIRNVALYCVRRAVALRDSTVSRELLELHTFRKCSHFIPPLVFICLIPFAFTSDHHMLSWIMRASGVYLLVTFGIALTAVLTFVWVHFDRHENKKKLPLRGILNIGIGIVWIIIVIVSVSILVDRSPMTLLAGLGAFAAALMLIFKDSILGFVAGIQLSQNDMLRVGDWIVVPSTLANGIVTDVTLSVVKVQNFDNTMVMLPPYTLVSTSFQNWRAMTESGYRRFSRDIYFDQSSIVACTDTLIDSVVKKYPIIADFVAARRAAKAKGEGNVYNPGTKPNGTIDTNLGLFRAYVCQYLLNHPAVGVGQDMLVRLQDAKEYGQSLNIYFFTSITSWIPYAALGSEIYEHIAVASADFGLTLYNAPDRNTFTLHTPSPATTTVAGTASPKSDSSPAPSPATKSSLQSEA